jgi:hypothetical protein
MDLPKPSPSLDHGDHHKRHEVKYESLLSDDFLNGLIPRLKTPPAILQFSTDCNNCKLSDGDDYYDDEIFFL